MGKAARGPIVTWGLGSSVSERLSRFWKRSLLGPWDFIAHFGCWRWGRLVVLGDVGFGIWISVRNDLSSRLMCSVLGDEEGG